MHPSIYILASLAVAGFATASAQNTGNLMPSRTQTPASQPMNPPPTAIPMPSPQTSPTPGQPIPSPQISPTPAQPIPTTPNSTSQQTVFPPGSRIDPNNPANSLQ